MPKTGNRIRLIAFRGQRFTDSVVIDPEVRVSQRPGKPHGYRCARLECRCGTWYLAQLSHLYAGKSQQCPACSRRESCRKRRKVGGLVSRDGTAWVVHVYVGRYRTREEAEAVAQRARAMLLPEKAPGDDAAEAARQVSARSSGGLQDGKRDAGSSGRGEGRVGTRTVAG